MNLRAPSMIDVAKHSGVSHQTVSRVLNNNQSVSSATRKKVLESIAELGYRPNLAARALVTGRTFTVGVLSFDSGLYGPSSMLHAIQTAAKDEGYRVILTSIRSIDEQSLTDGIDELTNSRVDGIVIISPQSSDLKELASIKTRLPVVAPESPTPRKIPCLNTNQYEGAGLALRHLLSLGHKKIGHISGPLDWFDASQRLRAWKTELEDAGLTTEHLALGDWTPQSGYDGAKKLMKDPGVTAIFAANDAMAVGVLHALNEMKLRVPEDVSVVGFDNIQESSLLIPGLTTVNQDFSRIGHELLALLIRLITHEKVAHVRSEVTPELVIRESTGKPRQ
jgi:DNA-binding LacI/PurR family transcriptional regulator